MAGIESIKKNSYNSGMKKSVIFVAALTMLATSLGSCKKQKVEFVGTPIESSIMMVEDTNQETAKVVDDSLEEEELSWEELLNPWADEGPIDNSEAENGVYEKPQEINIETYRHIQRFDMESVGEGLSLSEDAGDIPWVDLLKKDEKALFISADKNKHNKTYDTILTLGSVKGRRIPGNDESPDLFVIADAESNEISQFVIIPKNLPTLRVNTELGAFEFSEGKKIGMAGTQMFIFPTAQEQKAANIALIRYNTEEFLEPGSYKTTEERLPQRAQVQIISRTPDKVDYDGKSSFWFEAKRNGETFWLPGYNLLLQTGTFNRLNASSEIVYEQLEDENWFRLSSDFPRSENGLRGGRIVYAESVSKTSVQQEGRTAKMYRITYPVEAEIFGTYMDPLPGIRGSYSNFPENEQRAIRYPAQNDPEVRIYEAPDPAYSVLGTKYNDATMPGDDEEYSISVDGYTDIYSTIDEVYGRWYSVKSPYRGFIFVEQGD